MTGDTRRRKWRWLRHLAWVLGANFVLLVAGLLIFFGSGAGNPLIRRLVVSRLETITGGRVEVRTISINWLSLQIALRGVVIHGREPVGTEPFFAAEEARIGLRVDSFWG